MGELKIAEDTYERRNNVFQLFNYLFIFLQQDLPEFMYHYTTKQGLDGILQSGHICMSEVQGEFPRGVYFTDLDPNISKSEILRNNYGHGRMNQYYSSADYFIQFRSEELKNNLYRHEVNSRIFWSYCYKIYLQSCTYQYGKTGEDQTVCF